MQKALNYKVSLEICPIFSIIILIYTCNRDKGTLLKIFYIYILKAFPRNRKIHILFEA